MFILIKTGELVAYQGQKCCFCHYLRKNTQTWSDFSLDCI